ncbi:MAG: hypothetical protein DRI69_07895 [Bacteroidetes bacterium]|nr:MAG: hypothetical protein DRI69_07895 [Bacteroidota bacterium]
MEDFIGMLMGWTAFIVYLGVIIITIMGMWRVFEKAGQPGWASIIPIYNTYILLKLAGKPGWWLLLFFIPFVNIVLAIILMISVARSFDKDAGFAIGLIFLPFIFYPILGLGSAEYIGPDGYALIEERHDDIV